LSPTRTVQAMRGCRSWTSNDRQFRTLLGAFNRSNRSNRSSVTQIHEFGNGRDRLNP